MSLKEGVNIDLQQQQSYIFHVIPSRSIRGKIQVGWRSVAYYFPNLTSNEICSLVIVGILTADVYTENML